MKIGILTFHAPCNFGANLQTYSSQLYLTSLGHEVVIINFKREEDSRYVKKVPAEQYEAHKLFVLNKLKITKEVSTREDLQALTREERFDLIIVGADAVWRSNLNDYVFFLDWLFENKVIANIPVASLSAAHMGDGFMNQSKENRKLIQSCLLHFGYITVRDKWTKYLLCRDIMGFNFENKIKINPDPVLLLSDLIHEKWLNHGLPYKSYYLLSLPKNWLESKHNYIRQRREQWFNDFKTIVHNGGYQLVELPLPEGTSGMEFDYTVPYPIDPIQWFLWIKNAHAFCGLRFHAIVSSISSGTPFYSIDTYGSTSIISSALLKMGLYKFSRLLDKRSKIRNLLYDTQFSSYRVPRDIEMVNPKFLFKKLEAVMSQDVLNLKNKNILIFKENVNQILNIVNQN